MPSRDVVFRILGEDLSSPAFNRAAASAEGAAARISRAGDRMGVAGRKMTHTLTLPILGIAAASVKAATGFDASMTRIETQAGASRREVQFLTKEVLGMRGAQFGPNAAAASLYHLESVGIRGRKAILDLKQAEDLAAVGGADLAETTNALAGAWRTGIRGARDFHQAAATINAVIGAGNMTLPDLSAALGTGILPTAKTFGLTLKDVGSALALFTDEGVPADMAATRLRMTFSLLGAPTGKAEKQLKSIGITQYQLANDMRRRNGLIVAVGDLKTHLDNSGLSATKQAALLSRAFGGGRSSSAILSLVNNYEVLRKKQEQVTRTLARYDHAVKVQAATPQAQFKRALATLEQTGVLIGRDLLPLVVTGAQDVEHLAKAFDSLSPSQKHVAIDALLVVAALGPILTIAGRLTKVLGLASTAAVRAATFMSAPYRAQALSAETSALVVQEAQLSEQLAAQRASALIAVAEATKANAAAESAVEIAAAIEGTNSMLAADSTAAAENAIEFASAQQVKADAAVRAAAETDVAWTSAQTNLRDATRNTTTSVYGMQSAMMGLGIGLTVGTFTRGASTSTKLLSDLGAAAAGAAVGFSMGGPWGAAIGGLTGGLSSLAAQFLGTGRSASQGSILAQQALAQEDSAAQSLLGTLQSINGAYNRTARQEVGQQLYLTKISPKGPDLLSAAQGLGVNPSDLVTAVLGDPKTYLKVRAEILKGAGGPNDKLIEQVLSAFDAVYLGGGKAERKWQVLNSLAGKNVVTMKQLAKGAAALPKELRGTGRALGIGDESAFGIRNNAVVRANISYLQQQEKAHIRLGRSISGTVNQYYRSVGAIRAQLLAMGFARDDVDGLIARYAAVPDFKLTQLRADPKNAKAVIKQVRTLIGEVRQNKVPGIYLNGDQATALLAQLRSYLNGLTDKTITITAAYKSTSSGRPGGQTYSQQVPRFTVIKAIGGAISGPGTGTSDSIPAWLSNGEHVFTASDVRKAGGQAAMYRLRDSIQRGGAHFADGGAVGLAPAATAGHGKPRELRIKGGQVELRVGDKSFPAYIRELILDELDYSMGH